MISTKETLKYFDSSYVHLPRWSSYWYQIHELTKLNPETVLEIGAGNKIVSTYLMAKGIKVKTLDVDSKLSPDFVASVDKMPLPDNSFDVILASQVLEHLPFEKFSGSLNEIHRVTKKFAVVSLPHFGRTFLLHAKIPMLPHIKLLFKMPGFKKHTMGGEGHYWEIGKRNYPMNKIVSTIKQANFKMINHYICFENPYHHFFILEKFNNIAYT